jgi:hypothetical protein
VHPITQEGKLIALRISANLNVMRQLSAFLATDPEEWGWLSNYINLMMEDKSDASSQ